METTLNIILSAILSRCASIPVDMPTILELLAHLFLLLIFLLFSNYLSDFVLTDINMCLDSECEVDPLIEIKNDGESQEQGAQRSQERRLAGVWPIIRRIK